MDDVRATRWRRADRILWRRCLDTVVVLRADVDDAEPTTISGGGLAVWELLAFTPTTDELVAELADRYRADQVVVAADVSELLDQLEDRRFVHRVD